MTLVQYFCLLDYSFLLIVKINVWHSIDNAQWRIHSIDQWHSRLKTRICACYGKGKFRKKAIIHNPAEPEQQSSLLEVTQPMMERG